MSLLEKYQTKEVKKAIPKVSEYRERYRQKKITMGDITAPPTRIKIKPDPFSQQLGAHGIGDGLEQEF